MADKEYQCYHFNQELQCWLMLLSEWGLDWLVVSDTIMAHLLIQVWSDLSTLNSDTQQITYVSSDNIQHLQEWSNKHSISKQEPILGQYQVQHLMLYHQKVWQLVPAIIMNLLLCH